MDQREEELITPANVRGYLGTDRPKATIPEFHPDVLKMLAAERRNSAEPKESDFEGSTMDYEAITKQMQEEEYAIEIPVDSCAMESGMKVQARPVQSATVKSAPLAMSPPAMDASGTLTEVSHQLHPFRSSCSG